MATEPNPDTPSAAELAEALRLLIGNNDLRPATAYADAHKLLNRYDAAQKSPLDALLAWAPGPWRAADAMLMAGVAQPIAYVTTEVELCGHDAALLRFFAVAPQMLDALRKIAVYPDYRHSEPGDAFMAISNIAKIALQAAGDKP